MGTFAGHALPGSFFLMFGIWSTIFQLKKYYRRKKYELGFSNHPVPVYKNQFTTPINCCEGGCCCGGREFPLDSLLKAICCAIGITGEVYTGFQNGKFVHLTNAQHSTMFAMFMLAGIFELLNFYHVFRFARCVYYLCSKTSFCHCISANFPKIELLCDNVVSSIDAVTTSSTFLPL